MKKVLFGFLALLLVAAVVGGVLMMDARFEYVRTKSSATSSESTSTETSSQAEPSIESVLGNYAEFLTQEYFEKRFTTFVAFKDLDGNGVEELLLTNSNNLSYIDVYTFKDGLLSVGRINNLSSSSSMTLYECEGFSGVCRVTYDNLICYYYTIEGISLTQQQVWANEVNISDDEALVEATRNAYDNNTYLEFEVLSSFSEMQQQIDNHWYYKISRKQNCWSQTLVYGTQCFYYVADDGLYRYELSARDSKMIDGHVGGLYYQDNILYYSTKTQVLGYNVLNDTIEMLWDMSTILKGNGIDTSEGILDFKFHGDYIYIKNSAASAFRVNLKTQKSEMFLHDFSDAVFNDEYCYYIDQYDKTFSVFSVDLETLDISLVAGEGLYNPKRTIISRVFMIGDELYYYDRVTEKTCHFNGFHYFDGNPENVYGHDGDQVYCVKAEDGKVKVLSNKTGSVDTVVQIDDATYDVKNYLVTPKAVFVIPQSLDEKISIHWY